MIDRRAFITSLCFGFAATVRRSFAQAKIFRVGLLWPGARNPYGQALLDPLRKLGYVEGQNLVLERRFGEPPEFSLFASQLVSLKVDVIYAGASSCVRAARNATREIPIVATDLESDPVASGYAASLAHPGGNLTGFFLDLPEFSAKRLEILKEMLPAASRVMVLWDPSLDRTPLTQMQTAARNFRLRTVVREVHTESELTAAFKDVTKQKPDVVMVMQSPTLDALRDQILELAQKNRVPVMAVFANFTAGGALLNYGPNVADLVARSAGYIDKILKGARPGDLPIQRPTKFDLVVNAKTARSFGIAIPQQVQARADQVIE